MQHFFSEPFGDLSKGMHSFSAFCPERRFVRIVEYYLYLRTAQLTYLFYCLLKNRQGKVIGNAENRKKCWNIGIITGFGQYLRHIVP